MEPHSEIYSLRQALAALRGRVENLEKRNPPAPERETLCDHRYKDGSYCTITKAEHASRRDWSHKFVPPAPVREERPMCIERQQYGNCSDGCRGIHDHQPRPEAPGEKRCGVPTNISDQVRPCKLPQGHDGLHNPAPSPGEKCEHGYWKEYTCPKCPADWQRPAPSQECYAEPGTNCVHQASPAPSPGEKARDDGQHRCGPECEDGCTLGGIAEPPKEKAGERRTWWLYDSNSGHGESYHAICHPPGDGCRAGDAEHVTVVEVFSGEDVSDFIKGKP